MILRIYIYTYINIYIYYKSSLKMEFLNINYKKRIKKYFSKHTSYTFTHLDSTIYVDANCCNFFNGLPCNSGGHSFVSAIKHIKNISSHINNR